MTPSLRALALAALILGCPALASGINTQAVTVGTTSGAFFSTTTTGQAGQLPTALLGITVINQSTTATLTFSLNSGSLPTAATNAAGSITLSAQGTVGSSITILDNGVAGSYMACIASGASTPGTIIFL